MARHRAIVTVIAAALLMSACTSGSDEPVDDEVKGIRVENDDSGTDESPAPGDNGNDDNTDETGTPETEGDNTDVDVPEVAAPLDGSLGTTTEVISETVTVEVPVSDLPVETLGDLDGINTVSLDWSATGGVQSALSSATISRDDIASVRTSLKASGTRISVEVTLTNDSDDRVLAVSGRLVHKVSGLPGGPTTLRSGQLDRTLAPGATISETFVYTLPTDAYTLTSAFSAN